MAGFKCRRCFVERSFKIFFLIFFFFLVVHRLIFKQVTKLYIGIPCAVHFILATLLVLLLPDEHSGSADFGGGLFSSSCFQLCGQRVSTDIMVTYLFIFSVVI